MQCNGQEKKDKQRSKKHSNTNRNRVTQTPLKPGVNASVLEGWAVPAPLVGPVGLI